MPSLSQANRFVIEETSGSRRTIALTGRSLPYQGVPFGGSQRHKLTWYPGNPSATLQVLGPEEAPTTVHGIWKDRFLPNQVEATGFPDLADAAQVTAERLVQAFESLRRSGNRLRVQWGSVVREGILGTFTPTYTRIQDVEWECEFIWAAADTFAPRAADTQPDSRASLRRNVDRNNNAVARAPANTVGPYRNSLNVALRDERSALGRMYDALRIINSARDIAASVASAASSVPLDAVAEVQSTADTIRRVGEDTAELMFDLPYLDATLSDGVVDVLLVEGWRRTVGYEQAALVAQVLKTARAQLQLLIPSALTVVTVPGETTLRALAFVYYGNADDWQRIADINFLSGSTVAAGTVLVIPPSGARD